MKFLAFMSRFLLDTGDKLKDEYDNSWWKQIIEPLVTILDSLLIPVIILIGVAGAVYAIVLGVQYAKAESADKRDEAKKRLINAVIGIVIALIVLIAMKIFVKQAPSIAGWVVDQSGNSNT